MSIKQTTVISSSLTRQERKGCVQRIFGIYRSKKKHVTTLISFVTIFLLVHVSQPSTSEYFLTSLPTHFTEIVEDKPLLFHFIHNTNENSFHRRSLRSIESVFYHHPDARVIIHIPHDADTIGLHSDMTNKPILPLQKAGYNITVEPFQLKPFINAAISQQDSIVKRRKAERWMSTEIMKNFLGNNWYVDISDLVRLLVLYTEGGMYLDTDVIIVKPLHMLPNSIGFERPGGPNNAVLKFEKGNTFVGECINEYFFTYRSSTYVWGYVGPRLLQRVFSRKYKDCQLPDPDMKDKLGKTDPSCPFVVLWKDAFYPNVDQCFVETENTQIKKKSIQENSFVVHLSNQKAKEELKSINITKMINEDTLCNWLLKSWCILCNETIWAD